MFFRSIFLKEYAVVTEIHLIMKEVAKINVVKSRFKSVLVFQFLKQFLLFLYLYYLFLFLFFV